MRRTDRNGPAGRKLPIAGAFAGFLLAAGLVWKFSAQVWRLLGWFIDRLPAGLAAAIGQVGPWILIAGGIVWLGYLYARPLLQRLLRPSPLVIIFDPRAHRSVRRNMRDYHIELRNRSKERTIMDVIAIWDETPFTRFVDQRLARDWLLSPTSIPPSASVSVFLFSAEDDLAAVGNKNPALGKSSSFRVWVNATDIDELTAHFKYDPGRSPKLRRLRRPLLDYLGL
jgi:hypothetical protein